MFQANFMTTLCCLGYPVTRSQRGGHLQAKMGGLLSDTPRRASRTQRRLHAGLLWLQLPELSPNIDREPGCRTRVTMASETPQRQGRSPHAGGSFGVALRASWRTGLRLSLITGSVGTVHRGMLKSACRNEHLRCFCVHDSTLNLP